MYRIFIKRLLSILLSIIGLPFFAIIYIIVAPLIVAEDKGPVFYSAPRLGKDGKLFKMYKFRSMKVNAPDIRNADGSTFNSDDDPRVTKIGRILRKTSVDETPQILNVLKGDMSIIGPRPFVPVIGKQNTSKAFQERLTVRPGITGYTQAYYRNSISQEEKIKMDAEYSNNVSFICDLRILLKTIGTVLLRRNVFNKQ